MTIAENLDKIKKLDTSAGKSEEQLRMSAYLLANREYIKYLFDQMFCGIPPAMLGLISKLMPKGMEKEKWHELPINGVYGLRPEEFEQFFDMLASMVDYCRMSMPAEEKPNEYNSEAE